MASEEVKRDFERHGLANGTRYSAFAHWVKKGKAERGERGKYRWKRLIRAVV